MITESAEASEESDNRWRLGLRFKFVIAIAVVLTVTLSTVAVMNASSQQRLLKQSLDEKAHALGQFVALISPQPVYAFDITTLDRFVQQVSGDPDVLFAQIRNQSGQAMTTYLPAGTSRKDVSDWLEGHRADQQVEIFHFPILDEGNRLGEMVVAVDFTELNVHIRDGLVAQMLLYLGIILFLALMIFHIFRVNVLRPVQALMQGANRASLGEYDHSIPVMSDDELGTLAHCFNDMMSEIRNDRERLLTANRDLATEMHRRQQAARELQMLSQAIEQSPAAVAIAGADRRIVYVNPEFVHMSGFTAEQMLGQPVASVHRCEPWSDGFVQAMQAIENGQRWQGEVENRRRDGTRYWEFLRIAPIRQQDGEVSHSLVVQEDITQRKESEHSLKLAASVFTYAREGITITQADGTIIEVNDAFSRITGYARSEVIGENPRILKSDHHDPAFYQQMWQELSQKGHWYGEIWNRRKNGEVYPELLTISGVRSKEGDILHFVALFTDITAQKTHEQQLEHIAHFDALTNLPNRVLLADRLQQSMAQAERRRQLVAVAYIDLDGFKEVNDGHGHETGDQVLIRIAELTRRSLRDTDTIARIGGDEFVAVLTDLAAPEDCVPLLRRLLEAVSQPIHLAGQRLRVSASVGVTFFPQDDDVDADQLLRQADQAMYQAKLLGKNRYHLFDMEQDRNVRGQYESLERIRHALDNDEFVLYYQPKVNMRSGEVSGVEALIRWQHPERGLLLPGVFLPVLEDNPLAVQVGDWVLDQALAQMAAWRAIGLDLPVSVNVAARHLQAASFGQDLKRRLELYPAMQAGRLQLEVLETSALDDIVKVSQIMQGCAGMGVGFALDDFGTGYSSLTYLRRLPAEQLKIDFSFVRDMLDDPEDLAILEGVLGLARAFHRQPVAEGVETVAHGVMLLRLGCELGQGYAIARPMPAEQVPGWVASWTPDPSWTGQLPLRRDQMPTLYAATEHRAWMRTLEEAVRDELVAPPPLGQDECRFGHWLAGAGDPGDETLERLRKLHERVHRIGGQLLELRDIGNRRGALDRLPELHEAGAQLLAQLDRI